MSVHLRCTCNGFMIGFISAAAFVHTPWLMIPVEVDLYHFGFEGIVVLTILVAVAWISSTECRELRACFFAMARRYRWQLPREVCMQCLVEAGAWIEFAGRGCTEYGFARSLLHQEELARLNAEESAELTNAKPLPPYPLFSVEAEPDEITALGLTILDDETGSEVALVWHLTTRSRVKLPMPREEFKALCQRHAGGVK